ncbi:MAG: dTDP-4-dehydrorhamnose 3,5-epimerase [Deltaproteobacteria bacterium]|nr:dTDP-4-dehydrorhamnose 3,5-epimerase [Deltaproteobacteria bacterium]
MKSYTLELPELLVFEPKIFGDNRGFFLETWNEKRYREAGFTTNFVQDNLSFSRRGVLRGLHFQEPHGQGKFICVLQGEVHDVTVDIRRGSPTFGKSVAVILSGDNKRQLYVPPGFAHGFCVTSETALFTYKCTDYYRPEFEHSLLWCDPELGIEWPISDPQLAEKDRRGKTLKELSTQLLPAYQVGS